MGERSPRLRREHFPDRLNRLTPTARFGIRRVNHFRALGSLSRVPFIFLLAEIPWKSKELLRCANPVILDREILPLHPPN